MPPEKELKLPACAPKRGPEAGATGVCYTAANGSVYEVDVVEMRQVNTGTLSVREVRRFNDKRWYYGPKIAPEGGLGDWCACAEDVSERLEALYQAGVAADGNRCAAQSPICSSEGAADCARGLRGRGCSGSSVATTASGPRGAGSVSSLLDGCSDSDDPGVPARPVSAPVRTSLLERAHALELELPQNGDVRRLEVAERVKELALQAAVRGGPREAAAVAALLGRLAAAAGLRCTPADARRACLEAGSMTLLQAVLRSQSGPCLVGLPIFDRRHSGLRLNVQGRKECIRCLLSRGMVLGPERLVPQSKLLRKVEADAGPLWTARSLDSMMRAWPALPEAVRARVEAFL